MIERDGTLEVIFGRLGRGKNFQFNLNKHVLSTYKDRQTIVPTFMKFTVYQESSIKSVFLCIREEEKGGRGFQGSLEQTTCGLHEAGPCLSHSPH